MKGYEGMMLVVFGLQICSDLSSLELARPPNQSFAFPRPEIAIHITIYLNDFEYDCGFWGYGLRALTLYDCYCGGQAQHIKLCKTPQLSPPRKHYFGKRGPGHAAILGRIEKVALTSDLSFQKKAAQHSK